MKVWIGAEMVRRRWWFGKRTAYYVYTEFMRQGPYDRWEDAAEVAATLRFWLR